MHGGYIAYFNIFSNVEYLYTYRTICDIINGVATYNLKKLQKVDSNFVKTIINFL